MIRRSVAGVILGVSLLAGSFAWWGFVSLRTVLDQDRSPEVAEELLDNDEVREQLVDNISSALITAIPDEVPVSDEVVDAAAAQVLTNPAIEELILQAFTDTHAAFLGNGDAPESIDLTAVAEAARSAAVETAPQLEAVLPPAPALNVPLPTERIPDASPVKSFLEGVVPVVALGSVIGAAVALLATTDRPGVLRRAGRWGLTTAAVYLILGLGVPWLLRRFAPDGAEVFAALLAALLRAMLVPSIVLGVIGAGLLLLSGAWAIGGSARRSRPGVAPSDHPRPQPVPPRRAAPAPMSTSVQPATRGPGGPQRPQPRAVPRSPYPDGGDGSAFGGSGLAGPVSNPDSVFADIAPPSDPPHRLGEDGGSPDDSIHSASGGPRSADPYAPRWLAGQGWVLHPDDPRPLPRNAVWVDGVGHIVPGPPP